MGPSVSSGAWVAEGGRGGRRAGGGRGTGRGRRVQALDKLVVPVLHERGRGLLKDHIVEHRAAALDTDEHPGGAGGDVAVLKAEELAHAGGGHIDLPIADNGPHIFRLARLVQAGLLVHIEAQGAVQIVEREHIALLRLAVGIGDPQVYAGAVPVEGGIGHIDGAVDGHRHVGGHQTVLVHKFIVERQVVHRGRAAGRGQRQRRRHQHQRQKGAEPFASHQSRPPLRNPGRIAIGCSL